MKHLIIYAHPNLKSFCHAIFDTVKDGLKANQHEVTVRDLYGLHFDPVLAESDFVSFRSGQMPADIKTEQDFIRGSDVMTFIYPVWWTGLPALLKGYIDRVYTNGFAFSYNESGGVVGLLKGKQAMIFNTQGTPEGYYESSGMTAAMKKTSDAGIFQFCGIEVIEHQFFPGVPSVSDAVRKSYLEEVKKIILQHG